MQNNFRLLAILALGFGLDAYAGRSVEWNPNEDVPCQSLSWNGAVYAGCAIMRTQGLAIEFEDMIVDCDDSSYFFGPQNINDLSEIAAHMNQVGENKISYEAVELSVDSTNEEAIERLKQELIGGPVLIVIAPFPEFDKGLPFFTSVLFVYGFNEDLDQFFIFDTYKERKVFSTQDMVKAWCWDRKQITPQGMFLSFEDIETAKKDLPYSKMFIHSVMPQSK